MRDRDQSLRAWRSPERLQFAAPRAAGDTGYRALGTAANVRLKTALLNSINDLLNLVFGCGRQHVDNRGSLRLHRETAAESEVAAQLIKVILWL